MSSSSLFDEKKVIVAVCNKIGKAYKTEQNYPPRRGYDIIATKKGRPSFKFYIEAKGETSSRRGSERFGKPFDGAQVRSHFAKAFYKAAETLTHSLNKKEVVRVGIALPDNERYRSLVRKVEPVLENLRIVVFWVFHNGEVKPSCPWK